MSATAPSLPPVNLYYVAVKHQKAAWAEPGDQRYAIAVELSEEDRLDVDLFAEVQQQVQPRTRARVRI